MNYKEADELLGQKNKKTLHRSHGQPGPIVTWLERHGDHIGLWLIETRLIDYAPDGTLVLDSGGWQTATTKDRLNKHLPDGWRVYQDGGLWWLHNYHHNNKSFYNDHGNAYGWHDGITIRPDGSVENYSEHADEKGLKKKIDKYVKGYVEALAKGDVPAPGFGDCWDCSMRVVRPGLGQVPGQANPIRIGTVSEEGYTEAPYTKVGATRGECGGSDHLLLHMEEKYYVPSLLANAIKANGLHDTMSQMALWWVQEKWYGHESLGASHPMFNRKDSLSEKQTRNCLKKYLKKQLGLPF